MKTLLRNLSYALFGVFLRRRYFKSADLKKIEQAIAESEAGHGGEIAVVIETSRPLADVLKHIPVRRRAEGFFATERVWDTEANCGILVYLLLSEHRIELVADRGIAALVPRDTWEQLLSRIQPLMKDHRGAEAMLILIRQLNELLRKHFPRPEGDPNELSDRPVII